MPIRHFLAPPTNNAVLATTSSNGSGASFMPSIPFTLENLYGNVWSDRRSLLAQDIDYLTHIIMGHLMIVFSTRATLETWRKDTTKNINDFLLRTAILYPGLRPGVSIHALMVLILYKQHHMNEVAYDDDAEILFYIAFMQVAFTADADFNYQDMLALMCASTDVRDRFLRFRNVLNDEMEELLAPEHLKGSELKVMRFMEWFFAPFVGAELRRWTPGVQLEVDRCPTIPESSPYGGWDANDNQTRVFPGRDYNDYSSSSSRSSYSMGSTVSDSVTPSADSLATIEEEELSFAPSVSRASSTHYQNQATQSDLPRAGSERNAWGFKKTPYRSTPLRTTTMAKPKKQPFHQSFRLKFNEFTKMIATRRPKVGEQGQLSSSSL